jgi:hypothetical protein
LAQVSWSGIFLFENAGAPARRDLSPGHDILNAHQSPSNGDVVALLPMLIQ